MEVPQHILTKQEEQRKQIEDWEKGEELKKKYPILRRRYDVCLEAKPVAKENVEAQRAVQYHQSIKDIIQKKLDDISDSLVKNQERYEANKNLLQQRYEKDLLVLKQKYEKEETTIEKSFNYHKEQEEQRRLKVQDNMNYVMTRLKQAEERASVGVVKENKEEIALRKEIEEMIKKYAQLQPMMDLKQAFPDYQSIFRNNPPRVEDIPKQTTPPPPVISKPLPTPPQSLEEKEENEENTEEKPILYQPFPKVITNSKVKRAAVKPKGPTTKFNP